MSIRVVRPRRRSQWQRWAPASSASAAAAAGGRACGARAPAPRSPCAARRTRSARLLHTQHARTASQLDSIRTKYSYSSQRTRRREFVSTGVHNRSNAFTGDAQRHLPWAPAPVHSPDCRVPTARLSARRGAALSRSPRTVCRERFSGTLAENRCCLLPAALMLCLFTSSCLSHAL